MVLLWCTADILYSSIFGNNLWLGRNENFLSVFCWTVYETLMTDANVVVAEWLSLKMVYIISDICASLSAFFLDWGHALQHSRQVVVENGILKYLFYLSMCVCVWGSSGSVIYIDVCWWVIACNWIVFYLRIPHQMSLMWDFSYVWFKAKQMLWGSQLLLWQQCSSL